MNTRQRFRPDPNWTNAIEQVLTEIGEEIKGYKWMNITAAAQQGSLYNRLYIALVVITSLAGVLAAVVSAVQTEADYIVGLKITVSVLSFTGSALGTVIRFMRLEEKTVAHKSLAGRFASLENNIRRQLSLERTARPSATVYLDWVSSSYDNLFQSMPIVSDKIQDHWREIAMRNHINVPSPSEDTIEEPVDLKNRQLQELFAHSAVTVRESPGDDDEKKQHTGTLRRRRSVSRAPIASLEDFNDPAMRYQLGRLFGLADERL